MIRAKMPELVKGFGLSPNTFRQNVHGFESHSLQFFFFTGRNLTLKTAFRMRLHEQSLFSSSSVMLGEVGRLNEEEEEEVVGCFLSFSTQSSHLWKHDSRYHL